MAHVFADTKDKRSYHSERQHILKKTDRKKSHGQSGHRPVWKVHKGWGTRSGRHDCEWRNYGRHDDAHGPKLDVPEFTIDTVYRPWLAYEVDESSDVHLEWDMAINELPSSNNRPMEVSLIDISQPAKSRRKDKHFGFEFIPGPSRVMLIPDASLLEIKTVPEYVKVMDEDEWVDLIEELEQPARRSCQPLTYAQIAKSTVHLEDKKSPPCKTL